MWFHAVAVLRHPPGSSHRRRARLQTSKAEAREAPPGRLPDRLPPANQAELKTESAAVPESAGARRRVVCDSTMMVAASQSSPFLLFLWRLGQRSRGAPPHRPKNPSKHHDFSANPSNPCFPSCTVRGISKESPAQSQAIFFFTHHHCRRAIADFISKSKEHVNGAAPPVEISWDGSRRARPHGRGGGKC